jgi:hypothetical protein
MKNEGLFLQGWKRNGDGYEQHNKMMQVKIKTEIPHAPLSPKSEITIRKMT